jgi:hypothetical protein
LGTTPQTLDLWFIFSTQIVHFGRFSDMYALFRRV